MRVNSVLATVKQEIFHFISDIVDSRKTLTDRKITVADQTVLCKMCTHTDGTGITVFNACIMVEP